MKYQQVSVDFVNMVFTACSYLALAGAAWIFLRLLQACFWLPRHLRKQNDVQAMLQEKVDSYEKYLLECEEKEKAGEMDKTSETGQTDEPGEADELLKKDSDKKSNGRTNAEKWKERRECLEMLKRELKRVRDGGDIYDWDYLLEDDDKPEDENATDVDGETDESKKKTNDIVTPSVNISDVDCEIVEDTKANEEDNEDKKEK